MCVLIAGMVFDECLIPASRILSLIPLNFFPLNNLSCAQRRLTNQPSFCFLDAILCSSPSSTTKPILSWPPKIRLLFTPNSPPLHTQRLPHLTTSISSRSGMWVIKFHVFVHLHWRLLNCDQIVCQHYCISISTVPIGFTASPNAIKRLSKAMFSAKTPHFAPVHPA